MTFERQIRRRSITLREREQPSYALTFAPPIEWWLAEIDGATANNGEVIVTAATGPTPAAAVAALEAKLARHGITVIT